MRLTIPHYFDFGRDRDRVGSDLVTPASWDAARDSEGPFGLPATRAAWESRVTAELERRAGDIAGVAASLDARRLCSYGVGTGVLELCLTRLRPDLDLVCTDYAPRAVDRLARLFPEATVLRHDLRVDPPQEADLHVLHRVDTELGDADLRALLRRFREPVLLVPGQLLNLRLLAREAYVRLRHRHAARAGWVRTESAFRALWREGHRATDLVVGDSRAFLLEPRNAT